MPVSTRTARRTVVASLVALAAAAVAAATLAAPPTALAARATAPAAHEVKPSDRWLDGLTAKRRQFFDSPAPAGGVPLVHILNYYETLNKAYGVKDAGVDAVGTFYGATTFYALNDAMWAKYRLGEFLETNDPATGRPAVANPWRAAPVVLGMTLPQASVESLSKRGATFIVCNNALQIFAGLLAAKRGLEANAVYEDLRSNILPGVHLVPAMVVAIEQAQRAGLSYHRQ